MGTTKSPPIPANEAFSKDIGSLKFDTTKGVHRLIALISLNLLFVIMLINTVGGKKIFRTENKPMKINTIHKPNSNAIQLLKCSPEKESQVHWPSENIPKAAL